MVPPRDRLVTLLPRAFAEAAGGEDFPVPPAPPLTLAPVVDLLPVLEALAGGDFIAILVDAVPLLVDEGPVGPLAVAVDFELRALCTLLRLEDPVGFPLLELP